MQYFAGLESLLPKHATLFTAAESSVRVVGFLLLSLDIVATG
jgi:hypothetical protein